MKNTRIKNIIEKLDLESDDYCPNCEIELEWDNTDLYCPLCEFEKTLSGIVTFSGENWRDYED